MPVEICPKPIPWDAVYRKLKSFAETHPCQPGSPPTPLVLNGWVFTSDDDKRVRWADTVQWAERNGCSDLIELGPDDFYRATP